MDLKTWENEALDIYRDLTEAEGYVTSKIPGQVRIIVKLKAQAAQLQAQLSQNLESILYTANPDQGSSQRDSSLFYWANHYASRAQRLMRTADKRTLFSLWLRLVQSRIIADNGGSNWSKLKMPESMHFMSAFRRRRERIEEDLREGLQLLDQEKRAATIHYNTLVLTRANREAAGSLQCSFGDHPRAALQHPLLEGIARLIANGSVRIRRSQRRELARLADKLQQLTAVIESDDGEVPPLSVQAYGSCNALDLFDKITDGLRTSEVYHNRARDRVEQLRVKAANREAFAAGIEIPVPSYSRKHRPKLEQLHRRPKLTASALSNR